MVERELPKLEVAGSRPVVRFFAASGGPGGLGLGYRQAFLMTRIARSIAGLTVLMAVGLSGNGSAAVLPEELPRNVVAVVSHVPPSLGTVTVPEFRRRLIQRAAQKGLDSAPKPGEGGHGKLKDDAVEELLKSVWLRGEARAMGIEVTSRQIARELARLKEIVFRNGAEYRQFLRESHYTRRDINENVENQLISAAIQRRVVRGAKGETEVLEALEEFVDAYEERWRARTLCAQGYVLDRCSNGSAQTS